MSDSGRHRPVLDRRSFLTRTTIAASSVLALPRVLDALPPSLGDREATTRPVLLELEEVTLGELADGMASGRWTSRSLVDWYLDAIDRIDRGGPRLNAILELNPEARSVADALDAERQGGAVRGPLHGVPILVKDNIGTADRMHTSAGSLALAMNIAPKDAFVVRRLREAGAVILGKANMSEWANARGRASVGGWSGRGGSTRNPYALDRSAGGSSSGTAAAVGANLVAAAVGTETMGSIVTPAALCGVVGLKPTVGLVSRSGIIPVSYTQDTAGPMTRTVRDAALLLSAIAGRDPDDAATSEAATRAIDYTTALDPDGLRGARIGVARNLFGLSLVADRVVERALGALREGGAELVDPVDVTTAEAVWGFDAELLAFELKASLNAYLATLAPNVPVRTLADLIAFNRRHSDRELLWFGQETFEYAQERPSLESPEYDRLLGLVRQLARTQGIDATLATHRLDAIVAPTTSPAWLTDHLLGDNAMLGSFVIAAAAGYPSLTVPAGDVEGLPVGMLFFGGAWQEATLLKLGYAFEQRVRARREPSFRPTVGLSR